MNRYVLNAFPAALVLLLLSVSDAWPLTYTLTTTPDPIQGGIVTPNCSAGCLQGSGATVGLFAIPFAGHIFCGWSGACSGMNPITSVTMSADQSCAAGFTACADKAVEIGSAGYADLSSAYAVAGEDVVIEMLATNLLEAPNLDRNVPVTLKGGYGCGFPSNPSMTLLLGPLTISRGTVTVENLIIVGPLSTATGIAPSIPRPPDPTGFNVIDEPAVSGNVTQEAAGTTGSDRITQYGGTGAVVQTASGDAGNDWILQVCGGTSCNQTVYPGDGIDTVYQFGGPGTTSQWITIPYTEGDTGSKTYVQVGGASPNTQIAFGSTGIDRIFQYGGAAGDLQSVSGGAGDDHIEQYGGGGLDNLLASSGTGNDFVYQKGGAGSGKMNVIAGDGDDSIVQIGGPDGDDLACLPGDGNDNVRQAGGGGNDTIGVVPGYHDDTVYIDGGTGDDTISYDEGPGMDTADIDGGEDTDTLIVNENGHPLVLKDAEGNTLYQTGSDGSLVTFRNMEFLIFYGDAGVHVNENVIFTLTFASGSLNSVPAGADMVTVFVDGAADIRVYRLTSEKGKADNPLRVAYSLALPGDHTYTARAWSGSTLLATIGPISFTTVDGFPLTIPLAFSFPAFDNYHTDLVATNYTGTAGRDRVVQYGGAAIDTLSVSAGEGNDWCEQYGGDGDDTMLLRTGTGEDYACQNGGPGKNSLALHTGEGNNWSLQHGGIDMDTLNSSSGSGDDYIRIEGAEGNDSIRAQPNEGNDTVAIDAGPGDDAITCDLGSGTDAVSIDGGDGADTLIINRGGVMDYNIKDALGTVLFSSGTGGTAVTVLNIEQITVLDEVGNTIYSWSPP
jgi:Ca2+-binding RTX toxin-like protein